MRVMHIGLIVVMIVGALAFLEGAPAAAPPAAAARAAVTPQGAAVLALHPRLELVIQTPAFLRFIRAVTCEVGWQDCWARVAAEAEATPDRLYVLWEDRDGCVRVQAYAVDRPFVLEHQGADWVRAFAVVPNGSRLLGITHTEVTVLREMPLPGEGGGRR